jgi:hypothetical protein
MLCYVLRCSNCQRFVNPSVWDRFVNNWTQNKPCLYLTTKCEVNHLHFFPLCMMMLFFSKILPKIVVHLANWCLEKWILAYLSCLLFCNVLWCQLWCEKKSHVCDKAETAAGMCILSWVHMELPSLLWRVSLRSGLFCWCSGDPSIILRSPEHVTDCSTRTLLSQKYQMTYLLVFHRRVGLQKRHLPFLAPFYLVTGLRHIIMAHPDCVNC